MLCHARHPSVVLCYGACVEPQLCIVTALVPHDASGAEVCDLRTWARGSPAPAAVSRVAREIARTMLFLHRQFPPIIHRDLRASNVLMDVQDRPVIVDFGLSCFVDCQSPDDRHTFYEFCAPEVASQGLFSEKSDVFSFGLLLWELQARRRPDTASREPLVAALPPSCDGPLRSLISGCLSELPEQRPSFDQVAACLDSGVPANTPSAAPTAAAAPAAGSSSGTPLSKRTRGTRYLSLAPPILQLPPLQPPPPSMDLRMDNLQASGTDEEGPLNSGEEEDEDDEDEDEVIFFNGSPDYRTPEQPPLSPFSPPTSPEQPS